MLEMRIKSESDRTLGTVLVLSLILLFVAAVAPKASWAAGDDFFYYSDGQRILLTPSRKHLALRFVADVESGTLPDFHPLKESFRPRKLPLERLELWTLDREVSRGRMKELLSDLRERFDIELVAPVFEAPGALMIVTDVFIAQLAPGTSESSLEELNGRIGVEIVEQVDWSERTYLLRVREGDCLEVANLYHELKEIQYAHPDFVRVIERRPPALGDLQEPVVFGPEGRRLPSDTRIEKGMEGTFMIHPTVFALEAPSELSDKSPPPQAVSGGTIKWEDFEGSFPNNWELFGSPTWDDETYRSYGGSWSGYAVGSGIAPPGPYPNNAQAWMIYGPFSLADAKDARLDLQAYIDTEPGYDFFWMLASLDGNSFSGGPPWSGYSGGWVNIALDLKRVPGLGDLTGESQVWVALLFQSDGSITDEGVYVDNVIIEKITGGYQSLTSDTYDHLQWSLNNNGQSWGTPGADISAPEAWGVSHGSSAITVAIIDEGVDLGHPDLAGKLVSGYDATGNGSGGGPSGDDAHGTNCAGIAAALTDNAKGVAGVAWAAKIMPVRIGMGSTLLDSWAASGINFAANNGADVLSNSWGGGLPSTAITNAINNAKNNGRGGKGAVVVFATGNDNGPVAYPASLANVLAVGALSPCNQRKAPTSCDGEPWWGSNYGPELDLMAPGVHMYSTDIAGGAGYDSGNYFYDFNGTSSAAPVVAGVAALLLGAEPDLTATQVENRLRNTADDLGAVGFDNQTGHGRVNAYEALLAGPSTYLLSVTKTGSGTGTVTSNPAGINCGGDCSESYADGTTVQLSATPAVGSTFAGWSGHSDCSDGSVTMSADKTCTATFDSLPTYTLSVSKTGSGTVVSSPAGIYCGSDCSQDFFQGTVVTLYGNPASGSELTSWSGHADCSDGWLTMNGSRSCTATFSPCSGVTELSVSNQTVSGTQVWQACNKITAGPGFHVASSGDVTFKAGNTIVLGDGFSVGGTFVAIIGAPMSP